MTGPAAAMPGPPIPQSPAYTAAWELFLDWCAVTGHDPMPARSSAVLAFLRDCPAAPATQALRVRAITAAHTQAGQPPPSRTPAILDIQRGRSRRPDSRIPLPPGHVDQLLATLPIHGWTAGWFGRRDRALLALADTGLPYRTLAQLRLGDVHLSPDGATITSARVAFGGMAATPKRATLAEAALKGKPFTAETFEAAARAVANDFQPLSDWRGTAEYRQQLAANFFRRFWLEQSGAEHRLRRGE